VSNRAPATGIAARPRRGRHVFIFEYKGANANATGRQWIAPVEGETLPLNNELCGPVGGPAEKGLGRGDCASQPH
jgi:hypothetical protein